MRKWSYDIIGTHLEIVIDTEEDFSHVFHQMQIRLQDFEAKFSRFIEWNWLHNLNITRRATLDEDAKKMLLFSLDVANKTDGYFDPTVGRRLTELGYWVITNYEWVITNIETYGDYRDIEINGDEVILHGDILLEFGGVGKGYLIDVIKGIIDVSIRHAEERSIQASESLDSSQAQYDWGKATFRYLINFGWDMYGCGGWRVGLESPFASDEIIGTYIFDSEFLACSAGTKRKWWDKKHHLIDPHTGEPAREVVASYIEWNSGIFVDSYATVLCVMPWEWAIDILKKTPEISGVIVRYDGILFQKEGSKIQAFK